MNEQLAETIGVEGYIYLYPLVLMDTTRRQITNVEKVSFSPLRTPADVFINIPAFPPANFGRSSARTSTRSTPLRSSI